MGRCPSTTIGYIVEPFINHVPAAGMPYECERIAEGNGKKEQFYYGYSFMVQRGKIQNNLQKNHLHKGNSSDRFVHFALKWRFYTLNQNEYTTSSVA